MAEALMVGGIGTIIGVVLGPYLGRLILQMMTYYGAGVGRGNVSLLSIVFALVMGLGISLLAVLIPARRATRISPMAAFRSEEGNEGFSFKRKWSIWGVSLIGVLAVYLIVAPPGEWVGNHQPWDLIIPNLLFLPWLAGLALILPQMIELFIRLSRKPLSKSFGTTGRLMVDNLGRDRMRVVLTILTFAIGIAMMVGLNGILAFTNGVLLDTVTQDALQDQAWFIYPFDRSSGLAQMEQLGSVEGTMLLPEVVEDVYASVEGRAGVGKTYLLYIPSISSPLPGFPSIVVSVEELIRTGAFTFTSGIGRQLYQSWKGIAGS